LHKKRRTYFRLQRKTATLEGKAWEAENSFLPAFSRQKLVEAVPAERVRL
jgi:23S rRNA maturation-related 3'-5' exoribonuclease YhaM